MNIIQKPSPNFNDRPRMRGDVTLVILHGTVGKSVEGDVSWIVNPASKVSYHYVTGRGGEVYQCVDEADRAWHAGDSEWEGVKDVNDFSIGIGMTNRGPVGGDARKGGIEIYPTEQIMATAELVVDICGRHRIPWRRILTHAQISPGRKTDPWLHFPIGEMFGALLSYEVVRDHGA